MYTLGHWHTISTVYPGTLTHLLPLHTLPYGTIANCSHWYTLHTGTLSTLALCIPCKKKLNVHSIYTRTLENCTNCTPWHNVQTNGVYKLAQCTDWHTIQTIHSINTIHNGTLEYCTNSTHWLIKKLAHFTHFLHCTFVYFHTLHTGTWANCKNWHAATL